MPTRPTPPTDSGEQTETSNITAKSEVEQGTKEDEVQATKNEEQPLPVTGSVGNESQSVTGGFGSAAPADTGPQITEVTGTRPVDNDFTAGVGGSETDSEPDWGGASTDESEDDVLMTKVGAESGQPSDNKVVCEVTKGGEVDLQRDKTKHDTTRSKSGKPRAPYTKKNSCLRSKWGHRPSDVNPRVGKHSAGGTGQ